MLEKVCASHCASLFAVVLLRENLLIIFIVRIAPFLLLERLFGFLLLSSVATIHHVFWYFGGSLFMSEKKQNSYYCYNYNFFLGISYVMFTPESLLNSSYLTLVNSEVV